MQVSVSIDSSMVDVLEYYRAAYHPSQSLDGLVQDILRIAINRYVDQCQLVLDLKDR